MSLQSRTNLVIPALVSALVALSALPAAAHKPHEHGIAKLDIAVEGDKLSISFDSPLDNLLGFERAPRTDAERKAAAELLARLEEGGKLFIIDASAACTQSTVEIKAPVLEAPARAGAGGGAKKDAHADLEAAYTFRCAQPQNLRQLEVALFDAYRRLARIEVQVVGPKGQAKVTLRRPAKSVMLAR
jgi:hypothetical protein